jgi:hypothetical protein
MSSNKNIYEVFDDFKKATTREERIAILRKNESWALKNVLLGAFNENLKFTVNEIPNFKRVDMPPGLAYSNMTDALSRAYLFVEGNPRVAAGLTEKRKTEILIQILESLEEKEADVFADMLMKKIKVPYLTPKMINETFPGLLPES